MSLVQFPNIWFLFSLKDSLKEGSDQLKADPRNYEHFTDEGANCEKFEVW